MCFIQQIIKTEKILEFDDLQKIIYITMILKLKRSKSNSYLAKMLLKKDKDVQG